MAKKGFRKKANEVVATTQNVRRRVAIATPVKNIYAAISPLYNESLADTIKIGQANNIDIFPLYQDDSLIQRARNYLMSIVVKFNLDDLVWIDADMGWNPKDFFKLLSCPVDVVGGTYRKGTMEEAYTVQVYGDTIKTDPKIGLLIVDGLGTGFLRFSKQAFMALWDASKPYTDGKNSSRWCFELTDENGELAGEDIGVCHKLEKLGFKIYLDPNIVLAHVRPFIFKGSFADWLKKQDSGV